MAGASKQAILQKIQGLHGLSPHNLCLEWWRPEERAGWGIRPGPISLKPQTPKAPLSLRPPNPSNPNIQYPPEPFQDGGSKQKNDTAGAGASKEAILSETHNL